MNFSSTRLPTFAVTLPVGCHVAMFKHMCLSGTVVLCPAFPTEAGKGQDKVWSHPAHEAGSSGWGLGGIDIPGGDGRGWTQSKPFVTSVPLPSQAAAHAGKYVCQRTRAPLRDGGGTRPMSMRDGVLIGSRPRSLFFILVYIYLVTIRRRRCDRTAKPACLDW
ncbi:hypothetical protein EDB86DRAFT_1312299 [Lactarius hatsudake]|nr:hypothetical protein EDB86DRAFT_1312299 [Lactarius hatsudake]